MPESEAIDLGPSEDLPNDQPIKAKG